MKINQGFLRSFAAFMILIFHLWITCTSTNIELFIVRCGYIGVDIFFFLSAYSMYGKEIEYGSFVLKKFLRFYLKFIILVAIMAFYSKWSALQFAKVILGYDFLINGGGSFLWFGPALMIFYLLFPWFHKWNFKYKGIVVLAAWFIIGVFISNTVTYSAIFIFFNRIPVILCGYYFLKLKVNHKAVWGVGLTIIGLLLMYFLGTSYKLTAPIHDLFYVLCIPTVLGLALLSEYIKDGKFTNFLSSFSFELYGLQMIFGFDLAYEIFTLTGIEILSNIIVIIIMYSFAFVLSLLFKVIFGYFNDKFHSKKKDPKSQGSA